MDAPSACYQKPFYLFHYNKPKLPDLPKIRKIKQLQKPKIPVKLNNATKMRNKVIRLFEEIEPEAIIDYKELVEETSKHITEKPHYIPLDTKTSQYRYKWVRDVPVVSCRFTEYVMMYKKPPFTFEKDVPGCGSYKLRRMGIASPEPEPEPEIEKKEEPGPLIPSILQ